MIAVELRYKNVNSGQRRRSAQRRSFRQRQNGCNHSILTVAHNQGVLSWSFLPNGSFREGHFDLLSFRFWPPADGLTLLPSRPIPPLACRRYSLRNWHGYIYGRNDLPNPSAANPSVDKDELGPRARRFESTFRRLGRLQCRQRNARWRNPSGLKGSRQDPSALPVTA